MICWEGSRKDKRRGKRAFLEFFFAGVPKRLGTFSSPNCSSRKPSRLFLLHKSVRVVSWERMGVLGFI